MERDQQQRMIGIGLVLIRLALAREFLIQGSGILFGMFQGPGVNGFAHYAHLSVEVALLVGLAQFFGGLMVLTGIGARAGAAMLIVVLVAALSISRIPSSVATDYALTQLVIALATLAAGAGPYSLVEVMNRNVCRLIRTPFC